MPDEVLAIHIEEWRQSRLGPSTKRLAIEVLRRAAQGMNDEDICRYLDYCKRGFDEGSAQRQTVENVKAALLRDGSRLRQGVCKIREDLERIEQERKKAVEELSEELKQVVMEAGARWAWADELRYKNSLIPPGARGGGGGGRRRKKAPKRGYRRRDHIERHDAAMRRRSKGSGSADLS